MRNIDICYWIDERGIPQVDFVADNDKDIYTYWGQHRNKLPGRKFKSLSRWIQPKLVTINYKKVETFLNLLLWA